ncbi:MAG: SMI1/KNR4 family protein [Candidatus Dojkabacteria bacterium]
MEFKLIENKVKELSTLAGVVIKRIVFAPSISLSVLKEIEERIGFRFPESLRSLYTNQAGCVKFSWSSVEELFGSQCNKGFFKLASPTEIRMRYEDMKGVVEEYKDDADELNENEGAQALVTDWRHWIPIMFFPNGDAFCIETRENNYPIVFLEHDVIDGGPNLHGLKIAKNTEDLIDKWSKLFFVDLYDWTLGVNDEGIDLSKDVFNKLLKYSSI